MNKEDMLILTLPIKPQKETNIGMMISPIVMDFIGDVLGINKCIGFNLLHSYDDKDESLENYLNYVNMSKINYDSIFIDKDHAIELIEIIDKMYYDGFLKIKTKEKIRCECGRVDMIPNALENGKLYTLENDKYICNCCKKECKRYLEKSLVFELKQLDKIPSICPTYLNKEMNGFITSFNNSEILVSKNRDTGYILDTLNGKFNIDVDFIWGNYFKLYHEQNQIYIASNHQLFIMFLMSYLSKTTSSKNLTFIANPYLNVDLKKAKQQYDKRLLEEYKKLIILYNLKWQNKDCKWSDSIFNYLNNISDTRIKNLYKSMVISSQELLGHDLSIEQLIYKILNDKTNMQNNIKTMKKMYSEGRL